MGEFINPADVPKVKFYTGDEAPCIGMGTFGSDRFTADQIAEAVDGAIKSGYRMFEDVYKRQGVNSNEYFTRYPSSFCIFFCPFQ